MIQPFKQNTIALVYDFDGTLSPQPMQEYTVLPELGVSSTEFWEECKKEAKSQHADPMLTYMRLLIEKMEVKKKHLDRKMLRQLAEGIEYFPGVLTWFNRVNSYVKKRSNEQVHLKHYVISAGLKEILEGIKIKEHFACMYASEYFFDHHDVAKFPTIVINDVSKTQYLFRINKGFEDINEPINQHMPEEKRAIPFENIIYIGDGSTDVPCMSVAKKNGGYAMAVYKQDDQSSIKTCKQLAKDKRIDYDAPANYSQNSILEKRVHLMLDVIIAKIILNQEKFNHQLK